MKITLTEPVSHGGKTYWRVRLRIPRNPSKLEDSCPEHIAPELWNTSVLTGLPLEAAAELAPADIIAISREFTKMAMARAPGGRFQ